MMRRALLLLLLVIGGLGAGVSLRFIEERGFGTVRTVIVQPADEEEKGDASPVGSSEATSSILFAGDIMLDRSVRKQIEANQDPLFPFIHIADTLKQADFTVANLEGPVTDRGTLSGSVYSFRFEPVGTINALSFAGIDLVSLANNHIWDYGVVGLTDTVDYLKQAGIGYAGAGREVGEANEPYQVKIGDANVAFFSYTTLYSSSLWATTDRPGVSSFTNERAVAAVREFSQKKAADVVVVLMHWGDEYATSSNSGQKELGRALIDAGADLVVGHHPHVVQEVERYEGTRSGWIAYSLGNFVFDQYFSENTMRGLLLKAIVKEKKIIDVESINIQLTTSYQPFVSQ